MIGSKVLILALEFYVLFPIGERFRTSEEERSELVRERGLLLGALIWLTLEGKNNRIIKL